MQFTVTDSIPCPEIPVAIGGYVRYPFSTMRRGESFYVEGRRLSQIRAAYAYWSRKTKRTYIARKEGKGIRVWRVR